MAEMTWGLMWHDDNVSMEERVRDAALRYQEKHGEKPNTCFVFTNGDPVVVEGLTIIADDAVLDENHVWVGIIS